MIYYEILLHVVSTLHGVINSALSLITAYLTSIIGVHLLVNRILKVTMYVYSV